MKILAIDPGPAQSALLVYDENWRAGQLSGAPRKEILEARIWDNGSLLAILPTSGSQHHGDHLVVEKIESYGMPVGAEVFDTCVWIGRFIEAWGGTFTLLPRREVKLNLCGSAKARDANVRQALIDRFGPPGTKKAPGRTYGLKGDLWSALAVAVTYLDRGRPRLVPLEEAP